MKFTTTLAALLSAPTIILAASVSILDVWVPTILSPDATTVWSIEDTNYVQWDLGDEPSQITNPTGTIYLSKDGFTDFGA